MKVLLIKKDTNEVISDFSNVIQYSPYYVKYASGMGICVTYADEDSFFIDESSYEMLNK